MTQMQLTYYWRCAQCGWQSKKKSLAPSFCRGKSPEMEDLVQAMEDRNCAIDEVHHCPKCQFKLEKIHNLEEIQHKKWFF